MELKSVQHVVVYRHPEQFCGWPFNGGFWRFSDGELAVGFVRGHCDYSTPQSVGHRAIDSEQGEHLIIRSRDQGLTWPEDTLTRVYKRPQWDERAKKAPFPDVARQTIDPTEDGYCLLAGYGIPPRDDPTCLFITTSRNRGYRWSDPVRLRDYGFHNLGGRPSYVVRADGMLLLFAHGSRTQGERSAVPIVLGSPDGGATWGIIGEVELTPAHPMGIMPYPLLLPDGTLLIAVRRQYSATDAYTQIYASRDGGRTWRFYSRVNDWGAPASLTLLPDGRIVCVYGYRRSPWGIRAAVSLDMGATWSAELILRDDGGSWDLGYPRTLLGEDGTLVTVYYFNDRDDTVQQNGGVRYIAATLWTL